MLEYIQEQLTNKKSAQGVRALIRYHISRYFMCFVFAPTLLLLLNTLFFESHEFRVLFHKHNVKVLLE